ncbi:MAG TPA: ABC transporter permease [Stellaceae bacterium]|jgi:NitT/TauT family transport system permease protein|nr:ABC transporter permease [Stellaceae bacterium]
MILRFLIRIFPLVLLAGLWEIAPRIGWINPEALPPASAVAAAWYRLLMSGDLIYNGVSSLINVSAGLSLGIVVGIAAGVLMAWYPAVDAAVSPLMKSLYPMPKSALIPVMILWFGLGAGSKIASIFMGCLLPVVLSSYNGARGVEQTLIWSALGLGASRRRVLWEVIVPGALPEIMAGTRNALAISFILLVSSEFLVGQRGLGYLISFLGDGGVYDAMFAGVLTVSAIGFFADRIYLYFMQRTLRWRE